MISIIFEFQGNFQPMFGKLFEIALYGSIILYSRNVKLCSLEKKKHRYLMIIITAIEVRWCREIKSTKLNYYINCLTTKTINFNCIYKIMYS